MQSLLATFRRTWGDGRHSGQPLFHLYALKLLSGMPVIMSRASLGFNKVSLLNPWDWRTPTIKIWEENTISIELKSIGVGLLCGSTNRCTYYDDLPWTLPMRHLNIGIGIGNLPWVYGYQWSPTCKTLYNEDYLQGGRIGTSPLRGRGIMPRWSSYMPKYKLNNYVVLIIIHTLNNLNLNYYYRLCTFV